MLARLVLKAEQLKPSSLVMKGQRRTSSRFHVHFSASLRPIPRGASPPTSSPRGKPAASLRVAVVDDDPGTQQALRNNPARKTQRLIFETYRDYSIGLNSLKR